MHRILQDNPGTLVEIFTRLGYDFPTPSSFTTLPTDLTEIRPLERRVDTVLQCDTEDGGGYILVVESQGKKDPKKHGSWALYLAFLYEKYGMPAILVVVCQDEATARWASEPFHMGVAPWRSMSVCPFVVGPHNLPFITDASEAAESIGLASYSAIAHGKRQDADIMLKALATALRQQSDKDAADYFKEFVELGLGVLPAAHTWRTLMAIPTSYFRSETAEKVRVEGEVRGEAKLIIRALTNRGIEVTDAVRERITTCTDLDILDHWVDRAYDHSVVHAEEIFDDA